jgi:Rrf2 family protein
LRATTKGSGCVGCAFDLSRAGDGCGFSIAKNAENHRLECLVLLSFHSARHRCGNRSAAGLRIRYIKLCFNKFLTAAGVFHGRFDRIQYRGRVNLRPRREGEKDAKSKGRLQGKEKKECRGMQLQITTDYAIRMIGYLAQHKDQLVTARNMAGELGITYQYSMKVINQLKKGKLICSVQGCNGGYHLTEMADLASFYDVIRLMEGEIRLNRCTGAHRFCNRGAADYCEIHKVLLTLQEELIEGLKSRRIADVWGREKPLKTQGPISIEKKLSQTG